MLDMGTLFQGFSTFFAVEPKIAIFRLILIFVGIFLVYLGAKRTLEPLIMVPMGIGMSAVNAGVLFFSATNVGTLFIDPMMTDVTGLMSVLQIDFLQPIYTFTFSNNLIACIVFMGIGVITDVGFLLAYPFTSMLIAICAEAGTILTYPIARLMGLEPAAAAAAAIVGTADGPMVLFSSLILAPELFVPITVIAYLYLSLTYAGYPYLVRLLVPKHLRGKKVEQTKIHNITSREKLVFAVVANTLLCILLPMAAPLIMSFFIGVAIRESGITPYIKMIETTFLYAATFFLGLLLGVLCEAGTILDPRVATILILGIIALLISGIGGIFGGYLVYWINGKNFNPVIGIAGVSCMPTTAKIAQHEVTRENKSSFIISYAMGATVCGVLTSAILTALYITIIPML